MGDHITVELYEDAVIDDIESVDAVRRNHIATVHIHIALKRVAAILALVSLFAFVISSLVLLAGVNSESFGIVGIVFLGGIFGFPAMVVLWLYSFRAITHSMAKFYDIMDVYGAEIEMVKALRFFQNSSGELIVAEVTGNPSSGPV